VVQTLLGSTLPPDLVENAEELLDAVKDMKEEDPLSESCPACGIEVPLTDIRGAVCGNGHVWSTSCALATCHIIKSMFHHSPVFCDDLHFVHSICADVCWMQAESVLGAFFDGVYE
jgi:hypothetical protein